MVIFRELRDKNSRAMGGSSSVFHWFRSRKERPVLHNREHFEWSEQQIRSCSIVIGNYFNKMIKIYNSVCFLKIP